jgi:P27 family predicted phage terminase small subunit
VKRAHGERRSSRLNPREPRPQAGAPPKPRLGAAASAEWDRLAALAASMKVLTVADGPALEAVAIAYEDHSAARAVLRKEGRFYTTETASGSKMRRTHPAVMVAAEAWRRYICGLALFGLSPAMRTKVQTAPQVERDDVDLWLIEGGKRA